MVMDPIELSRKIRAALAPCSLGTWPTPVDTRPDLAPAMGRAELWLKREDLASLRCGGNKVRGLEFLLAGLPAGMVCVTVGGLGSTHCLATATHARDRGLRTVLAQFPQPETATTRALAAASAARADLVVYSRSHVAFPFALWRAWRAAGLASGAARLLARRGIPIPHPPSLIPRVVDGVGPGYGHPTPAGEEARELAARHGVTLDSTYSAKAFAALVALPAGFRRVMFWHTFAAP